ncbi:MAG TPA: hypothetical protein VMI30_00075, partial [Stellaceae bacterium]|nr:hypothetical protein [Stellaceae bacterium]
MAMFSRPWRVAVWFGIAAAFFAGSARALDSGAGSKNFNTPSGVPNYFSNEAGPMIGGAAETRRGELYSGQAPAAQAPVAAPIARPAAASAVAVAPVPAARQHIAMAVPRGHSARTARAASVRHAAVYRR